MTKKSKIRIAIMIIITGIICYYSGTLAYSRLFPLEERKVILTDVGATIKSLKYDKITSFIGYFTDQKTNNEFDLEISADEYKDFEKLMNPIEMTKKVGLDRVEKTSTGTNYLLLAGLSGALSITLFIFCFTPFIDLVGANNVRNGNIKK